jgi:anti-sigma factor RsiW
MDCGEILRKISAYNDKELSPEECKAVEAHLSGCEACRRNLGEIRRMDSLLARLPDVGASPAFEAELARRMERPSHRLVFLRSPMLRYALAASIMLAVGALAVIRFLPSHRELQAAELPNLRLLDDSEFLGIGKYNAGIGNGLEVQLALGSPQEKEE